MKKLWITLSLAAAVCLAAHSANARLAKITLSAFMQSADCGYLVKIKSTRQLSAGEAPDENIEPAFDRVASARVVGKFGPHGACGAKLEEVEILYSDEVHSSHPAEDESAIIFLSRNDDHFYRETVYGRSYWRVVKLADHEMVEVTWRNDFLIEPMFLIDDEVAYIPMSAVERLWAPSGPLPWLEETHRGGSARHIR